MLLGGCWRGLTVWARFYQRRQSSRKAGFGGPCPRRENQADSLQLALPGLWLWGCFPKGLYILGIFLCFRSSEVNGVFQHPPWNQDCPCLPTAYSAG